MILLGLVFTTEHRSSAFTAVVGFAAHLVGGCFFFFKAVKENPEGCSYLLMLKMCQCCPSSSESVLSSHVRKFLLLVPFRVC